MSTVIKDLGAVSAYAYAVEKGYTGTEAEFAELMADYAEVGQRAEGAANSASESKTAAQTAATTATTKASEAATSAQTATTKAGEATTAAGTATTAKNDAVAAKTAAETAQGKAEDAQAAAESVAESIPSDYSQLSEDVSDLKEGLNALVYKTSVISTGQGPKYTEYNFVAGKKYIVSLEKNAGSNGAAVVYTSSNGSDTVQTALSKINTGQTKIFTASANASFIRGWFTTGNLKLVVSSGELEDIRSNGVNAPYLSYNDAINDKINVAVSDVPNVFTSKSFSVSDSVDTSGATVYNNSKVSGLTASYEPIIESGTSYILDIDIPSTVDRIFMKKFTEKGQMILFYTANTKGKNYTKSSDPDNILIYNGDDYIVIDCAAAISARYTRMTLAFDSKDTSGIFVYNSILNAKQHLEYLTPLTGLNMFSSVACLGDSYTQGFIVKSDSSAMIAHKPYPAVLQDRLGITVDNYGVGGTTAKSYITHTDGLPKVLNASAHDLYMICFGINDSGQSVTIGTVADINDSDYTQNADTFCGNLGKMYQMLIEQFPNARYVFIGNWCVGLWYAAYYRYANAAKSVAEHFSVPYVNPLDDPFFYSDVFKNDVGGHPTQPGYTGMAYAVERLMAKCIKENYTYYRYAGVETV